jgi:Protein of unknown function, DUF481
MLRWAGPLLLALPLLAREKTDVVVLMNGDRMTGEVKNLTAGALYVSLDYVDGTISVQWSKVARLESSQQFLVQTKDGTRYTGTLSTAAASSGQPVKIQILESTGGKVSLEESYIVALRENSDRFWQRFDGEIGLSAIQSKGNNSLQYSLASQAAYRRQHWSALASYESSWSSKSGSSASTQNQTTLQAKRFLGAGNYFYAGLGTFLESSVQRISAQGGLGVGFGRFLKNTNHARITLLAGVGWLTTDYASPEIPVNSQNVGVGVIAADVSLFKFKKTNFSATVSLFPAFSNPYRGRKYLTSRASYYLKVARNLSWNFSFYGNWDSAPPDNFAGSDYGSSTGLSWTFGAR